MQIHSRFALISCILMPLRILILMIIDPSFGETKRITIFSWSLILDILDIYQKIIFVIFFDEDALLSLLWWRCFVIKNGRVPHRHWAKDDPKSEGSTWWRRSAAGDAYLLLRERGWDRGQVDSLQTGSAARNQEIFAGAEFYLGRRKKADENSST